MNAQSLQAAVQVLLIEPDGMVRGTVASVCRDLYLARVLQASSLAQGEPSLMARPVQGLMLSLAEGNRALDLLERLRAGAFASDATIPVVVLASGCTREQAVRLKGLNVRRLLLQPFRLRDVLHTVEQVWPAAPLNAQPAAREDLAVSEPLSG